MRLTLFKLDEDFDPNAVVTNPSPIDTKTKKFTEDGIFSSEIYNKNSAGGEIWACNCEEMVGRFYSGELCTECNTKVTRKTSEIDKIGWIDLEDREIISPFFFSQIRKICGDAIYKIIGFEPTLDLNGNQTEDKNVVGFHNIGLKAFREDPATEEGQEAGIDTLFEEVLTYYFELNKSKKGVVEAFDFILEADEEGNLVKEDMIWISKIPVYSPLLRPATLIKGKKKLIFAEENTFFNQILANLKILNNKRKIEKGRLSELPLLAEIQTLANDIFDKITGILAGKSGFLRSTLLGNRVNFSVRTVISPMATNTGHKTNSIYFPYLAATELFRFEIINALTASIGSYLKAERIWHKSTLRFDEKVYKIMEDLVAKTKGGLTVLVNRNPTMCNKTYN